MKFLFLISSMLFAQNALAVKHADVTLTVSKYTYNPAQGGGFDETPLCQGAMQIEVVDLNAGEQPTEDFYKVSCASTVGTEAVEVVVGGVQYLTDRKWTQLGLWVDPDSEANKLLTYNMIYGTELTNTTSSAFLEPTVDMDCQPAGADLQCTPTKVFEYFGARADVIDQP
jgi:hypothetical protein